MIILYYHTNIVNNHSSSYRSLSLLLTLATWAISQLQCSIFVYIFENIFRSRMGSNLGVFGLEANVFTTGPNWPFYQKLIHKKAAAMRFLVGKTCFGKELSKLKKKN